MTADEIKLELEARKLSFSAIGRRLRPKVSHVSVSRVVRRIPGSKSARIESAVSTAIGRTRDEVFGDAA